MLNLLKNGLHKMNIIVPRNLWYGITIHSFDRYNVYIYWNKNNYCRFAVESLSSIKIYQSFRVIYIRREVENRLVGSCQNFINNIENLNCRKLYYRKKGAWVKYRRDWPYLTTTKFGRGHPYRIENYMTYTRRLKRYVQFSNLLFIYWDKVQLNYFVENFKKIQRISVYTLRGVTEARGILIKKQGKVSQYSRFKSKIF